MDKDTFLKTFRELYTRHRNLEKEFDLENVTGNSLIKRESVHLYIYLDQLMYVEECLEANSNIEIDENIKTMLDSFEHCVIMLENHIKQERTDKTNNPDIKHKIEVASANIDEIIFYYETILAKRNQITLAANNDITTEDLTFTDEDLEYVKQAIAYLEELDLEVYFGQNKDKAILMNVLEDYFYQIKYTLRQFEILTDELMLLVSSEPTLEDIEAKQTSK